MIEPVRKFFSASVVKDDSLGDRQIRIVISDPTVDRGGDVMEVEGCILVNYQKNNIVLADHDPTKPIGNADIEITAGRIEALWTFAPKGISAKADEYCALYKAGVLKAASVGFDPLEAEPIKSTGGVRFKKWELLEVSAVAIPMQQNALTIARSLSARGKTKEHDWKVGASRNLPTCDEKSFNGDAARERIFAKAGFDGDAPDSSWARKGFLAYDAGNPDEKSAYAFPFADVVDGRLTVTKGGIAAAAARLAQADLPDDVATKARAVIDHYEEKLGMGKKAAAAPQTKQTGKLKIKGLYDVGQLAACLSNLGYIQEWAEWEEATEGDASKVPGMLAEAMRLVADALLEMTAEEVAELLRKLDKDSEALEGDSKSSVAGAGAPIVKALRIGKLTLEKTAPMPETKAGRVLSAANKAAIASAQDCISKCMEQAAAAADHVKGVLEACDPDDEECEDEELAANADEQKAASARGRELDVLQLADAS